MADEEQKTAPAPTPAKESSEVHEAMETLREYGTPILTGLILALLAVGGIQFYRSHKASQANQASMLLNSAQSADDLKQIVTQYAATPSGTIAGLALASSSFSRGQYQQAEKAFRDFKTAHPDHPMTPTAEYGLAQCLEAQNYAEEALEAYDTFIAARPDHYLTPIAKLARGRCLDQLGRADEARVVYEDFMAAYPDSPWANDAESLLMSVKQELRERKQG